MARRIYDREGHAHFVTFSCYRRRRLLDHDRSRRAVLDVLGSQLASREGRCVGFVLMPDHVHAIVWFPSPGRLGPFLKHWKRLTSFSIGRLFRDRLVGYGAALGPDDPVWQAGYYDFNLFDAAKVLEKLDYMHQNPVRAGLAARASEWSWSSARHYEHGSDVGVPIGWIE